MCQQKLYALSNRCARDLFMRKNNYMLILDAAFELFYANGYNNTSMADIAGKLHLTKPALSYHFGTKEELGQEVCLRYNQKLSGSFIQAAKAKDPNADPLIIQTAYLLWKAGIFYCEDKKAFRFFCDFIHRFPEYSALQNPFQEMYALFADTYFPEMSAAQMDFHITKNLYATIGLIYRYTLGKIECTQQEYLQLYFEMFFPSDMQDTGPENNLFERAMRFLKTNTFQVLPYYEVH